MGLSTKPLSFMVGLLLSLVEVIVLKNQTFFTCSSYARTARAQFCAVVSSVLYLSCCVLYQSGGT